MAVFEEKEMLRLIEQAFLVDIAMVLAVEALTDRLDQAARQGEDAILIAVEDSGPGVDPKKADSIFDAFVSMKPQGTGLGLAICRMIVERHDWQISACPAEPQGTLFRVVLPVR